MLDDRFPAMLVSETLATLVSSTSMNTASITVMAMIHGLTPSFDQSPRSSRRCALFSVRRLHLPHGVRHVRARLVEPVQRRDLVVGGAGERILRRNHFDIVGHARLE